MAKNGRIMVLYEGHLFRNSLYLVKKQKERKFCEKKIVDSGIVKTCDELDL